MELSELKNKISFFKVDIKKKQLLQDVIFFMLSIIFAIFAVKTGIVHRFVLSLNHLQWFGIIIAGMFFTSIFTTVPSIVLLGELSKTTPLFYLTILGGIGAMLGDFIIFYFMKNRVLGDIKYLCSLSKSKRFPMIFRNRIFRFFAPFVGALVIASPLPDEIGVALLGFSKVKNKTFFFISLALNSIGIFFIGLAARAIIIYTYIHI